MDDPFNDVARGYLCDAIARINDCTIEEVIAKGAHPATLVGEIVSLYEHAYQRMTDAEVQLGFSRGRVAELEAALLEEQALRHDYGTRLASAEAALAAEHARRCDLERRFDHRVGGIGVIDRARALCGRGVPADQHEINEAVGDLILFAQALEANDVDDVDDVAPVAITPEGAAYLQQSEKGGAA